jgi:hypothetical protein
MVCLGSWGCAWGAGVEVEAHSVTDGRKQQSLGRHLPLSSWFIMFLLCAFPPSPPSTHLPAHAPLPQTDTNAFPPPPSPPPPCPLPLLSHTDGDQQSHMGGHVPLSSGPGSLCPSYPSRTAPPSSNHFTSKTYILTPLHVPPPPPPITQMVTSMSYSTVVQAVCQEADSAAPFLV